MQLNILKSKIHRATVTQVELDYEGSVAIDGHLLDAAEILSYEQIHVWNVTNGERFITYAIRAEEGSGTISVNGSAARRVSTDDLLIIATFALIPRDELAGYQPELVYVDWANRITHVSSAIPEQMA